MSDQNRNICSILNVKAVNALKSILLQRYAVTTLSAVSVIGFDICSRYPLQTQTAISYVGISSTICYRVRYLQQISVIDSNRHQLVMWGHQAVSVIGFDICSRYPLQTQTAISYVGISSTICYRVRYLQQISVIDSNRHQLCGDIKHYLLQGSISVADIRYRLKPPSVMWGYQALSVIGFDICSRYPLQTQTAISYVGISSTICYRVRYLQQICYRLKPPSVMWGHQAAMSCRNLTITQLPECNVPRVLCNRL